MQSDESAMEAEALTEDLGRLAGLGPDNGDNVLRDIVCEHVNSLTSLIRDNKGDAYKDDDVYDDLGGFIVNWARLGLKLAERLSDDKDVNKLATARIDKEIELTDGSETKVLDETQNKRKILK
ncbi:hypothetical protein UCRPC4_g01830 [Phaeomoniella chlamydospora]|uniref:Uncharacterized protein n=1 Tax=Phaeomoniella chlamydospora TaxID=158046 RepID=A0A0G2ERG9_PHACM|nr:hypothetical protein UCRPC4_g01830 [Phaeomoniella chlamydospora]